MQVLYLCRLKLIPINEKKEFKFLYLNLKKVKNTAYLSTLMGQLKVFLIRALRYAYSMLKMIESAFTVTA